MEAYELCTDWGTEDCTERNENNPMSQVQLIDVLTAQGGKPNDCHMQRLLFSTHTFVLVWFCLEIVWLLFRDVLLL